ncbi:splicing factor 3B subunit 5/RDS3 complex subunit 10 [Gongronella butleri]|nr:splicing factor 3B subunit 5/RDS3 complex subunit 10 [Gongronella butleri]
MSNSMNSQLEHLQSKYVGTGHADTVKYEWMTNQHRDTLASMVGHNSLLSYISVAENESKARVKANLLEKMVLPCGLPPERKEI